MEFLSNYVPTGNSLIIALAVTASDSISFIAIIVRTICLFQNLEQSKAIPVTGRGGP
jgi:hypothetical protein